MNQKTKVKITPETMLAVNRFLLYQISTFGGQIMTFEALKYGLFVPDTRRIALMMMNESN